MGLSWPAATPARSWRKRVKGDRTAPEASASRPDRLVMLGIRDGEGGLGIVARSAVCPWRAVASGGLRGGGDGHHLAALERQRQLAPFQPERVLAKQLAPPAPKGGDIGLVLGGDPFEVVAVCNEARGDAVAGGGGLEQHLQQLERRQRLGRDRHAVRQRR